MSDETLSNAAIPLRQVETPPSIDPKLRRTLMYIGAQFSLTMVLADKMPEVVAKETGLSVALIDQVRAGAEPDIGIRSLAAIAAALGCALTFSVQIPMPTPAEVKG